MLMVQEHMGDKRHRPQLSHRSMAPKDRSHPYLIPVEPCLPLVRVWRCTGQGLHPRPRDHEQKLSLVIPPSVRHLENTRRSPQSLLLQEQVKHKATKPSTSGLSHWISVIRSSQVCIGWNIWPVSPKHLMLKTKQRSGAFVLPGWLTPQPAHITVIKPRVF